MSTPWTGPVSSSARAPTPGCELSRLVLYCSTYAIVRARHYPINALFLPIMLFSNSPVLPLLCFQPVPIMLKVMPYYAHSMVSKWHNLVDPHFTSIEAEKTHSAAPKTVADKESTT